MIRRIIQIDEAKCNGCGACAAACHEGAIGMVEGKARLLRDDYCDGLGDCLPACPTGAITFAERETAAYDADAVAANKKKKEQVGTGCPGHQMRLFNREPEKEKDVQAAAPAGSVSRLAQWPVQIQLVPVNAPYFKRARLLIAADCTAFAYAGMHEAFMKGKVTLIGCPKLDAADYMEKLTQIIRNNDIQSVTIVKMEVPCCCGSEAAAKSALQNSGKFIPWQVVTITIDGKIKED